MTVQWRSRHRRTERSIMMVHDSLRFMSRRKIQAVTQFSWCSSPENLRLIQTQVICTLT